MDQARKVGEKEKEKRQKEKDGYRGVTGLIEIGKPLDLYCEKGSPSVFFFILWYGVCMYFHQGPASYQKKRNKRTALPISTLELQNASRIIRTIIPSSFCLDFTICLHYCNYVTILI